MVLRNKYYSCTVHFIPPIPIIFQDTLFGAREVLRYTYFLRHVKILLKRFHLNGNNIGFLSQI